MALVPKLPDLSQSSVKLFEAALRSLNKTNNKNQLFPKLSDNSIQKINYSIQDVSEKPQINFRHLEWLLDVEKTTLNKNEIHQIFMNNYYKIFESENVEEKKQEKEKVLSRLYKTKEELLREEKKSKQLAIKDDKIDEFDFDRKKQYKTDKHNIGLYVETIHSKKSEIEDPNMKKLDEMKKLRKLLRKFPFERTDVENNQIFEILINYNEFLNLFSPKQREDDYLLKKYCATAYLETVSAKSTPVFGNFGFYLILKGSVRPLSHPHLNQHNTRLRNLTPEPYDDIVLGVGSCFGTITALTSRELTTRMFRVITMEDKCEFLKLSINSFEKVSKKITDEEREEKLLAIKNCKSYNSWPKHTIEELMEIFEWRTYPANTILTSEGYRCPFIAFINKGECHVLRKVDVPYFNKKTGKKEKRMKQVVIGKLKENDSFGEVSVVIKEPMTCSIVTETPCKIGIIPYEKISMLDSITLKLLLQTNNRNYADLTQNNIYEKFIEQEKKKEWKDFKCEVVNEVIDKYGITTGIGKYNTANLNNNTDGT